jgi:hypothetical protein
MKLRGRWLTREGDELVVEDRKGQMNEEGKGNEEAIVDLLDTGDGGTVEVEKDGEGKDDTWSRTSGESRRMRMGFDFLENMKEDTVDEDLEKTIKSDKKWKRQEDVTEVRTGMDGIIGWEWREREGREEKRWKREIVEESCVGPDGEWVKETRMEKIPLPDSFRLGLDGRGQKLNHSGRPKNNFGANKEPLFPGGKNGRQELGIGLRASQSRDAWDVEMLMER